MSADANFKKIRNMALLAIVIYDPLLRKLVVLFEMIVEVKDAENAGAEATGKYSLLFKIYLEVSSQRYITSIAGSSSMLVTC
jgi:hypothetical protein